MDKAKEEEETFQDWKGIQVIRLKGSITEQDEFLKGSLLDTFTRNFRMQKIVTIKILKASRE